MNDIIDFTNEDQLKWILQYQIDDSEKFRHEYGEIIDPNIRFDTFKISIGEYVELTGKEAYFEYLKTVIASSEFELIDLIASSKGDRFVVIYRQIPRKDGAIYQEGVTWFQFISILYVKNGMIYKIRSCSNTLKTLQEYGIVVMKTEDQERIKSYLQTLIRAGLLQERYIKMEN